MDALDPVGVLERILTEHGPLNEADLEDRLLAEGVPNPTSGRGGVLDEMTSPARQLIDDRYVWLPAVLAGRVFTHRMDADELAHDLLTVTPDLDPITELCHHEQYQRLADGSSVAVVLPDYDDDVLEARNVPLDVVDEGGVLLLPAGTLRALGVQAGDLVGVRLSDAGLVVERAASREPSTGLGDRFAATLTADEPTFLDAVVWTVCAEDPAAFTEPLPPLHEIFDAKDLAYSRDWLAPPGFDFEQWRFEGSCNRLALRYGIEPDDALALRTLVTVYEQMSRVLEAAAKTRDGTIDEFDDPGDDTTTAKSGEYQNLMVTFGSALADPFLATLLVNETVGMGGHPAALGLFAETLEPQVSRSAKVACRWLGAVALEQLGDVEGAEREYLAAESMNPDWSPTLLDLARFASDRGDVERGMALLRRADADADHPMRKVFEQHRVMPRTDLGRNDACWCGSGRKYKKCHLGHEQLSLEDRAGWVYLKASQHVFLTEWDELLTEAAAARSAYDTPRTEAASGVDDPLPLDAVLFEGGALEDFVTKRGFLLPADERHLVEQWLLTERSVYEVEQVQRGRSVSVRDVRTGDTFEVRERIGSNHLRPGELICAHVLPTGDTFQFFGGLDPVALHQRGALIELLDSEPDPLDLVEFLTGRFAPPTMVNTEGDPLAICEATVRIGDPDGIVSALDDAYDRVEGEEPPSWLEHVVTQGMSRISASLILEDDTLRVQTNSDNRMDRALATLARIDPAMTVLDNTRHPIRDARDAAALAGQLPGGVGPAVDPDDPDVAALLGEMIRTYETNWLDESIPALDGHTPRQAADDPTRRGDLIRLLDTFPAGEAARGGMDADRLRAALGLP